MLTAIMVMTVLIMLFSMAAVGHLSKIEKILGAIAHAKIEEMKMWSGSERK